MKIIGKNDKSIRYGDLKPGDVFDACGEPAIKTVDGRAVVLRDGNYVFRDPLDTVKKLDAAVHI